MKKYTCIIVDTNIKHISILLAGKDTSESSTADDDKFINAKNRGGLWKVSPGVFEIFLIVEKHFRANVTNQKIKIDVQLMVSTLMMNFSILSLFSALINSASEETERDHSEFVAKYDNVVSSCKNI